MEISMNASLVPLMTATQPLQSRSHRIPFYSSRLVSELQEMIHNNNKIRKLETTATSLIANHQIIEINSNINEVEINEKELKVDTVLADNTSNNDKNESDNNSGNSCDSIPASIGLLERLIRCHPIWFLADIGRAGSVHLLQGKEPGCFIVRQSSKPNTMALSVRLPEGQDRHIEHYLIEDAGNGKLHLENSVNYFSAIPMLVCHYTTCCDELPVQLTLPKVLVQSSRQQMTSLALLGQDFWQSSLSKLKNSSDTISDDNTSNESNSSNRKVNICSTFKSDSNPQPPPIPPKQDVSSIDPIIDTKKSSTVPIMPLTTQPKLPPKRPDPPPIPPRSKFNTLNKIEKSLNYSTNVSKPVAIEMNESAIESKPISETTALNTEITLIEVKDVKCRRKSPNNLSINSSQQSVDNKPKEFRRSIPNAQKRVLCYRSSLHDKESDYEDIWGSNTLFKRTSDPNKATLNGIKEIKMINKSHRSTQTESTVLNQESTAILNSYPFYIDPIDLISNRNDTTIKSSVMRRSDTDIFETKPLYTTSHLGLSMESLIDSIKTHSSQVDTCQQSFSTYKPNFQDVSLQVGLSTFARFKTNPREPFWTLDKSWQWLDDNISMVCRRSLQRESMSGPRRSSFVESMRSDKTTVEDMIQVQAPELCVDKIPNLDKRNTNCKQVDEDLNKRYDNLVVYNKKELVRQETFNDTDTEFSEPWDSDWWQSMLKKVFPKNSLIQFSPENEENNVLLNRELLINSCENRSSITSLSDSHRTSTFDITEISSMGDLRSNASIGGHRESADSERLTVLETNDCGIGLNICNYVFKLSAEGNNTFAKSVDHFIECTKETNDLNPIIVMRNIRQFMNGMKNYLVKHGEGQLKEMIEEERTKLQSNEFLNIDAILESALHRLVIKPLKNFLYQLFISEYNKNGSLKILSHNIKEAQNKTPQELGVRPELLPIDNKIILDIQKHLCRLQQSYSPLKKLEYLLSAISSIYNSVRHQKTETTESTNGHSKREYASFGADDFLPIFIYVLIQCGVISAEIEADYMFGLLHPSILSGEGGYYLTTLSSAVNVIKNMHQMIGPEYNTIHSTSDSNDDSSLTHQNIHQMNSSSSDTSVTSGSVGQHSPYNQIKLPIIVNMKAYMRVLIPDEFTSSIVVKTLPVRPNMTTKEICKMIAHKLKITNSEDFGLFHLVNGNEILLNDSDLPQVIKSEAAVTDRETHFAYKRFDAKFIWPLNHNF